MSVALLGPSSVDDFTPLPEHEAQTPSTFFGAKPVLHAFNKACSVLGPGRTIPNELPFTTLKDFGAGPSSENGTHPNALFEQTFCAPKCEIFVTSESVIISVPKPYNNKEPFGITIPYPAISLHAIQRLYAGTSTTRYSTAPTETNTSTVQAIFFQIDPAYATRSHSNPDLDDDEDGEAMELLLVPDAPETIEEVYYEGEHTEAVQKESVKALFEAISRCADLHPDPAEDGDGDDDEGDLGGRFGGGGGMPGDGGWITAENMHEFEGAFEDGQEDGEDEGGRLVVLGPGAGTRRTREDDDDGAVGEVVNGVVDETKWQRTSE